MHRPRSLHGILGVARQERDILERDIRAVSEQAVAAIAIVDEAIDADLDGSHPVTLHAKMLRLELLKVKADLERDLGRLVLDCSRCGQTVHWVAGMGVSSGHWAPGTRSASRARGMTVTLLKKHDLPV